jgi:ribosome-associated heat shock protein Hsp15
VGSECQIRSTREGQRIDRWLWHAALVDSGYVRVNGQRVRAASRAVRIGDVITVALQHRVRVLKVQGFVERRGPAVTGATLYEELAFSSGGAVRTAQLARQ